MRQDNSTEKEIFRKNLKVIQDELDAASEGSSRINLDAVRKRNAPLASVIDEFMMSKTTRDVSSYIANDVALAMEARAPDSSLGTALDSLGKKLETRRGQ